MQKIFLIFVVFFAIYTKSYSQNISSSSLEPKLLELPQDFLPKIKETVGNIKEKMTILVFSNNDKNSKVAVGLIKDLQSIFPKNISIKIIDKKDKKKMEKHSVSFFPTIKFLDKENKDHGVIFEGTPMGYELKSLLAVIRFFGMNTTQLPDKEYCDVVALKDSVTIEVLVTPSCPYCSDAVIVAHAIAFENSKIKAININAEQHQKKANKYNVSSVPLIIYNGKKQEAGGKSIVEMIYQLGKLQNTKLEKKDD